MEGLIIAPRLSFDGASFGGLRMRLWESSLQKLKRHPESVEG